MFVSLPQDEFTGCASSAVLLHRPLSAWRLLGGWRYEQDTTDDTITYIQKENVN